MRREIMEFRAWDSLNKKMTFWTMNDLCNYEDASAEKPSALDEWMQYTGLLDKNGKKIFEGDILKVKGKEIGAEEHIIKMEYTTHSVGDFINAEYVGFRDYSKSTYGREVEIIGEIYSTPELLKKE